MKGDTQHNDSQHDSFAMLSATNKPFMLSVVMLNAVTLSVAGLILLSCFLMAPAPISRLDPSPSDDGASVLPLWYKHASLLNCNFITTVNSFVSNGPD
jgi:hypothetical protein